MFTQTKKLKQKKICLTPSHELNVGLREAPFKSAIRSETHVRPSTSKAIANNWPPCLSDSVGTCRNNHANKCEHAEILVILLVQKNQSNTA